MTKKELIMTTLEKMGYNPETDNEGDIMFHYQLKTVFVIVGDEDDPYVSMILPQFYEIEDDKEVIILAVCNKMTRDLKMAKVFIDHTYKKVSSSCEFYYTSKKSLEQNLRNSLNIFGVIRSLFKEELEELLEES